MDYSGSVLGNIFKLRWVFIVSDLILLFVAYIINANGTYQGPEYDARTLFILRVVLISIAVISYLIGTKLVKFPKRSGFHEELSNEQILRIVRAVILRMSILTFPLVAGFVDFLLSGDWKLLAGGFAISLVGKFGTFLHVKNV